MDTKILNLVMRMNGSDPDDAAKAKAELEAVTAQFKAHKRSGVETR